jgi:hypothetical protein
MIRIFFVLFIVLATGAARFPFERRIAAKHEQLRFRSTELDLSLREQIGQGAFIAALSGFRSLVADIFFIEAHSAWERTEWGRVLLLFRQATTLQPRSILFWDMAAWHMAWNASVAASNDRTQPRQALRVKAQREYFALGKDFLERGVKNNPEQPQLYDSLARLYRDKYRDHEKASEYYALAAKCAGAPSYEKRFAAYELSYCEGREHDAYRRLHDLYLAGENERLPTLVSRLKFLEDKLSIPAGQRIPDPSPNQ